MAQTSEINKYGKIRLTKEKKAWSFFQETPFDTLCRFKFADFIKAVNDYLLPPSTESDISFICEEYPTDENLRRELYILAFIYRDTPYLHTVRQLYEKEKYISKTEKEDVSKRQRTAQISTLREKIHHEAEFLETMIFSKKAKKSSLDQKPQSSTVDKRFQDIYKKSISRSDTIILSELTNLLNSDGSDYNNKKLNALKRKYYRWRKEYIQMGCKTKKWPTHEFDSFCNFISWKYVDLAQGENYTFGKEGQVNAEITTTRYMFLHNVAATDFTVKQIIKAGLHPLLAEDYKVILARKYQAALNQPDEHLQLKALDKLAVQNYPAAIVYLEKKLYGQKRKKYTLQLAILNYKNYCSKQEWKARGFTEIPIEICSRRTELRNRKPLISSSGILIQSKTIIRHFSFHYSDISSERWLDLQCKLKKVKIDESHVWSFPDTPQEKHISIPATPHNMNELMKNADILPYFFTIHFSGGHTVETTLWRD